MITTFVRRIFPLLALGSILIMLVRVQDFPQVGSDAYLHLRLGSEFRSGWPLGHPGHLSVFDTGEWFPTQWLSQIVMSWTDSTWGMSGVIWLVGSFILALPVCMYLVCRAWVAPLPAAIAVVLGTLGAAPGLSTRPQVVSYLLILLVTAAWLHTAQDHKPRYWLIVITWVWVPLHAMWIVGISIGIAAVLGIALTRPRDGRLLARLASIPVLSAVVPMLTPLGVNVYSSIAGVGDRNAQLTEWHSPDFTSPNTLLLAAMIAIVLVVSLRGGPVEWPTLMILGLGMVWGLYTVRTTIVAAIILTPLLGIALQRLVPSVQRIGRRESALALSMLVVASASLAVVAVQRGDDAPVASWVDKSLDAMPNDTKVLNDWELGHYVVWRHPQIQLVMHGYVDMFTIDELERNIDIATLQPGWDTSIAELEVDYALVDPDSRLGYVLTHQLGWQEVEGDDDYVLLLPPAQT